jgi:hypothetical protein
VMREAKLIYEVDKKVAIEVDGRRFEVPRDSMVFERNSYRLLPDASIVRVWRTDTPKETRVVLPRSFMARLRAHEDY